MLLLTLNPALRGENVSLIPADVASVNIAGDAGAPSISTSGVGDTIYLRSREFSSGAVRNNVAYLQFDLSSLNNDDVIQAATLRLNKIAGDTVVTGRVALFGLMDLAGNVQQDWNSGSFTYGDEFDPAIFNDAVSTPGASPINLSNVVNFDEQEAVSGNTVTLSSDDLNDFLQSRVADDGLVTFILTFPSQGDGNDKSLTYASHTYTDDTNLRPTLEVAFSDASLPSPPSDLMLGNVSYSANPSLTINWGGIDGALSYKVFRRADGEEEPTQVGTVTSPSYFDDSVELFGQYYYSVAVVTDAGESVRSTELYVDVTDSDAGRPAAPGDFTVAASTPAQIQLGWNAVSGVYLYEVYRSVYPDRAFSLVDTVDTPHYTDDNVVGFRSYYYKVKSIGGGGISWASDVFEVEPRFVTGGTIPAAPQNLSLGSNTTYSTTIGWDAVADAQAYYVYRSVSGTGDYHLVGISETTSLEDTYAVMPQIAYDYTVYAAGQGGFSEPSAVLGVDATLHNYRQMENITRAPVAVPSEDGMLISWRLLGTDPENIGFSVYRDGHRLNNFPITGATNYLDEAGTTASTYEVRAKIGNYELPEGETARVLGQGYLSVPIEAPAGGTTPDDVDYTYNANDASVGDLDGDGEYEIVLKWDPTNAKDNSQSGYTGNVFIDAYEMDGTRLWRIDLGRNIRAGAHYTQFMVYDFDGDGRAEMICKTADATTDAEGTVIGDPDADYRNDGGYILDGPEFLTAFDGMTGAIMDTIDYVPPRGNLSDWGDTYGNRVDRFNAAVAYFDGVHPSFVAARGYYYGQSGQGIGRTVIAAHDLVDGQLVERWVFDSQVEGDQYVGQGNHQLTVGDADGDGYDEVMHGSLTIDQDGSALWVSGLGHGDAMHFGDLDPSHPGMEMFAVKEETGAEYHDVFTNAATGETIWGVNNARDTGRGLAADIDPNYAGTEVWGAANLSVWSAQGEVIGLTRPSINFAIWWDGDPLRELMDGTSVRKWDWVNQQEVVLLDATGTASNNGTKATPSLQADLLGDWREEVMLRTDDNTALRIYSTSAPTVLRIPTLMHDPNYRVAVAWQNSAYNQPPHPSFFIGNNMPDVAMPDVFVDPRPDLYGLMDDEGVYTTDVRVALNANLGAPLVNEYRVDSGSWMTYSTPFMVQGNGSHTVDFRTYDGESNLLAEASSTFTINAQLPGDLDGDNDVDVDDRLVLIGSLRKCEGDAGYNAAADLDGNGCVNMVDYAKWRAYYAAANRPR
ncbi:MAG: FG-GAP repeat-containing protein [Puniceicoccaceae bacterium 5H]|nr:MAG: FG-GAP repeat-containing protein [Puniceicoccaceae bacterium 5H]